MTKALSLIPHYAIYTLLVFTPLARASVQGWAITTIHMITFIALTAFVLEKTLTNNWKWITTPLDKPILILIILIILSTVLSLHFRTSLWAMALLVNYIIIFYLVIHTVQTRTQVRHLIYLIIGIATFLSVFGFFKIFGVNPFPWWDYADLPHHVRLTATFGNPDHLAGYMEMAIPLMLGLLLFGHTGAKRFLLIYLTFLLLTALLLTLSRGGWFGALTGLLFMAVCLLFDRHFKQKRLVLGLMAGTLAVALIVFASTPIVERILTLTEHGVGPNLHDRMVVWGGTTDMIAQHPLLGTGPGTFAFAFTRHQPPGFTTQFTMAHNDYLHFTSEVGLILIGILVWMLIALYKRGFKKLNNPSRLVRGTTIGAMSAITAILFHSIFDFNLHIPSNALLFTVLSALVVAPLPSTNELPIK
jgi:O-antigen ligase